MEVICVCGHKQVVEDGIHNDPSVDCERCGGPLAETYYLERVIAETR